MSDIINTIKGFDFTELSKGFNLDSTTLFVGLGLVFLLVYGLSLGRTKALISLLGIYVALAFDAAFPYLNKVHDLLPVTKDLYATRLIIFLLVYLIVFAILNNSFAKGRLTLKDSSILSVAIISLSQIGLLIAVITNTIPNEIIDKLPQYLSAYFGGKESLFFWIVLPIILLIFVRGNKKEKTRI